MTVVAIDGPAAAGKSTVARATAEALGFDYLDTGAMYRALALGAVEAGVAADDGPALARLAEEVDIEARGGRVTLDGRDVTTRVREDDVTAVVSDVSSHREVREAMVSLQREVAGRGDSVIEGRDIASVVAPGADVKIFLTASASERALRRARQLGMPLDEPALRMIETAIVERDAADAGREASPFVQAADAIVIDTTDMSFDEVVDSVLAAVRDAASR